MKLALCSDSNGTSAYVTANQIYGKLIADELGYSFTNYSVSGYTTAQIKICVDTAIANGDDVILMVAGTNDLSQAVSSSTSLETAMNNVTANVELAINAAKSAGKRLIVGSPILPNENYIKGVAFELERRLEALCLRHEVDFIPFTGFMQAINLKLFDAAYGAHFTVDKWHMLSVMHALWADFFMSRQLGAASPPPAPLTVLDLKFNGNFTDDSPSARTASVVGNTNIVSNQAVFDGSGDRIDFVDSADFTLGTHDFTIEAGVVFDTVGGFVFIQGSNGTNYIILQHDGTDIKLQVISGGSILLNVTAVWIPTTGVLYDLKVERVGSNFKFYVNGAQIGSTVTSSVNIPDISAPLCIGGWAWNGSGSFHGKLDYFKIEKM